MPKLYSISILAWLLSLNGFDMQCMVAPGLRRVIHAKSHRCWSLSDLRDDIEVTAINFLIDG